MRQISLANRCKFSHPIRVLCTRVILPCIFSINTLYTLEAVTRPRGGKCFVSLDTSARRHPPEKPLTNDVRVSITRVYGGRISNFSFVRGPFTCRVIRLALWSTYNKCRRTRGRREWSRFLRNSKTRRRALNVNRRHFSQPYGTGEPI